MNDNEILITVLMPVYNGEAYLHEAIESILNQTYPSFEFLIVDDGSSDASAQIIKSYTDTRIRLIQQDNCGVSGALNTGLKAALGKYIVRFDADDIALPHRIEIQLQFMLDNPDYVLVGSDVDYLTDSGTYIFSYSNTGHSDSEIRNRIYQKNPFIHSAIIARRDVILACGGYDELAHTFEDHLLWINILAHGKVCNLKTVLVQVRLNAQSVTSDERLRGVTFLKIRQAILNRGGPVTKKEGDALMHILKSQNSKIEKAIGYHIIVAKKFLWNTPNPKAVRLHCSTIIKLKPVMPLAYLLWALSFLPSSWILKLYKRFKS
jgi:glycosyltransferase involved in cell wall biosynthesis